MNKYFAFDVETTGLDHSRCAIVSIAYIILDDQFNELDYNEFHAHPFDEAVIDPMAIEINGYKKERWDELKAFSQEDLMEAIEEALMFHTKSHPVTRLQGGVLMGNEKLIQQGAVK